MAKITASAKNSSLSLTTTPISFLSFRIKSVTFELKIISPPQLVIVLLILVTIFGNIFEPI